MEKYVKAADVYFKHHLKYHLLAAILLFCLMPFLMGVQYLEAREAARTLEMYLALMGIVFLVPTFMPDQDKDIRDLLRVRKMPLSVLHLIRLFWGLVFLAAFIGAGILFLKWNCCVFPEGRYFWGTLAEATFLGGLGMFFYSLTDNIAVGYMVPIVYYMINFGGDQYLKKFYLFSMMGGEFEPKLWLAASGILLLFLGILWRRIHPQ